MVAPSTSVTRRPPPWRDVRVLRMAGQVAAVLAVVGAVVYLRNNLFTNLDRLNIRRDFGFLDQPAGFGIANSDFSPRQPILDALRVGAKNTALASIVGIILTTLIGTLLGIARLSTNWLVRRAAGAYVETLRNIPPLLVIFFMSLAVLVPPFLPPIADARTVGGLMVLSNKGVGVITPRAEEGFGAFLVVLGAALVAAGVIWVWRTRVEEQTGAPHHRVLIGCGVLAAAAIGGFVALGGPLSVSQPKVAGFQIAGGITMLSGYLAVTIGLTLYTASHVAEIVRGSILAVPKGQGEAAQAVALTEFQRLRFVILPQAFRVAIPPLINQYLNLTKNTSLGFAVGFAEITTVTVITIGNGKPAPQMILILMGVYLAFSIVISVLTNLVNRRLQLSERR